MKEVLVEFKTARIAKKIGFNVKTTHYYVLNHSTFKADKISKQFRTPIEDNLNILQLCDLSKGQPHLALAPTQSLLQKWLREEKNILVEVVFNDSLARKLFEAAHKKTSLNFHWSIYTSIKDPEHIYEKFWSDDTFETYEEALEEGLQKALKLI
jgi:hypothetical protein